MTAPARKLPDRDGVRFVDGELVLVARVYTPEDIRRRKEEDLVVLEAARRWAEENAAEIREYNEHIAKHGVWGEDLRTW